MACFLCPSSPSLRQFEHLRRLHRSGRRHSAGALSSIHIGADKTRRKLCHSPEPEQQLDDDDGERCCWTTDKRDYSDKMPVPVVCGCDDIALEKKILQQRRRRPEEEEEDVGQRKHRGRRRRKGIPRSAEQQRDDGDAAARENGNGLVVYFIPTTVEGKEKRSGVE